MKKINRKTISDQEILDFIGDLKRVQKANNAKSKNKENIFYISNGPSIIKGVVFELLTKDFLINDYDAKIISRKTARQGFDGVVVIKDEVYIVECKYKSKKIGKTIIEDAFESVSKESNEQYSEGSSIEEKYGIEAVDIKNIKKLNKPIRAEISRIMNEYSYDKVKNIIISCGGTGETASDFLKTPEHSSAIGKKVNFFYITLTIDERKVIDEIKKTNS